ncbi:hypothetical protein XPA_009179 [Xanthoria parietina]
MPIPIKIASLVAAAPILFWDILSLIFIRAEELSAPAKETGMFRSAKGKIKKDRANEEGSGYPEENIVSELSGQTKLKQQELETVIGVKLLP